jgi:hypothetical protein
MESLQFHCLNTAISLMSDEEVNKILLKRRIQLEKTRIHKYLATCDDEFKAAASKIIVNSAFDSGLLKDVTAPNSQYDDIFECQHSSSSYVVLGREERCLIARKWRRKCKPLWGNYHTAGTEYNFELSLTYGDTTGWAESKFLEPTDLEKGWVKWRARDCGLKKALIAVVNNLGVSGTDETLIKLMEMLFGADVVHKLGVEQNGNSFSDIVIPEKAIEGFGPSTFSMDLRRHYSFRIWPE